MGKTELLLQIIFDNDGNFKGREVDCDGGSGGEVGCGDSGGEVDGACCEGVL